MFEFKSKLEDWASKVIEILFCHRALYAGLSACHGTGCWISGKPELYGPIALLYAILALRG
ncbi:hypothetical protein PSJ8397_02088 [Pseudooctadecabacter jejudonensis]|uniref:Uncharacterized protein n=1 Tax=Pseudooctadecabacter jejudonensis TaxID=1391910 RepID=A0A1Y5SJG5_9RHOB|nr:hypothetical protein PSJ8397_02088 [Pseudooctadecabacter jejudonensis]